MKATRESYGEELAILGETNENIVVLDADLAEATKTCLFAEKYPNRFFDIGIAEQDLMGTAAGLATCGKIPFVSTFAVFATGRAYDQIRNSICYSKLNVKIAATHAGITVGEDGATHQALEDIALMRSMPNMKILCPCDDISTKWAINEASKIDGPVYIRLTRPKVDNIYNEQNILEFGKGNIITEGKDIAIISNGITLHEVIKANKILRKTGIEATIIDLHTIKPIDKKLIIETAKNIDNILVVEDHNVIGGIGSAVSDVLSEFYPKKIYKLGINDTFGQSGKWEELLSLYKIDSLAIVEKIHEILD